MNTPAARGLTLRLAAIMAAFSLAVLAVSYIVIQAGVTDALEERMAQVIEAQVTGRGITELLDDAFLLREFDSLQIINRSGTATLRNAASRAPELPADRFLLAGAFAGRKGFRVEDVQGRKFLVAYFPVNGDYAGTAALSMRTGQEYARKARGFLVAALPAILGLSWLLSRSLVRRAMRPIGEGIIFQENFSSNITHELRSPLASVKGNFEVTLRKERPVEEYREVLGLGLKEVNRLIDLLNNLSLLSSSRVGPLKLLKRETDAGRLISEAAQSFIPAFSAREIRHDLPEYPQINCQCDEVLVLRALENLFDNAAKYTPRMGIVRMRLGQEKGRLIIALSNTAEGLSAADVKRIFEPFYRGGNTGGANRGGAKAEGKGLGLHIARYIFQSHGGGLSAELAGGMLTFTAVLPCR